jgi:hypothetical protein
MTFRTKLLNRSKANLRWPQTPEVSSLHIASQLQVKTHAEFLSFYLTCCLPPINAEVIYPDRHANSFFIYLFVFSRYIFNFFL